MVSFFNYCYTGQLFKLISEKLEVAKNIKGTVPQFVAIELDVVYFPQIGYLITLPIQINRSALREEDFQFQVCYILLKLNLPF